MIYFLLGVLLGMLSHRIWLRVALRKALRLSVAEHYPCRCDPLDRSCPYVIDSLDEQEDDTRWPV